MGVFDPSVALLRDFVAINSVNPSLVPGAPGEAQMADAVAAHLSKLGLDVEVQPVAGLDHDLDHLARGAGEVQQRAGQDQVAGGRDRQELGQPLDDAHDQGLHQQHDIHLQLPRTKRRMIPARNVRAAAAARSRRRAK